MQKKTPKNKVVTKPQAQTNCDVTSFRSDMGTDGPTNGWTNQLTNQPTNQPTNIVSYRGTTLRLKRFDCVIAVKIGEV